MRSRIGAEVGFVDLMRVCLVGLFIVFAAQTHAHGMLCDSAAKEAAIAADVPIDIMLAVTRTETGRNQGGQLVPWPWAVNSQGTGYWLDNRAAALRLVKKQIALGIENFDIGCFQINYRWHGHAFQSLEDMLNPKINAAYAAGFLRRLFLEQGNWNDAVGAFHSRTPKFAKIYKARFQRILASAGGEKTVTNLPVEKGHKPIKLIEKKSFPTLGVQVSTPGALGSLFPSAKGLTMPFIDKMAEGS